MRALGNWRATIVIATLVLGAGPLPTAGYGQSSGTQNTSLKRAIEARRDVYGEAAMRRPNGASYEFFADLIAPIRCARLAGFEHYPIVLGLPGEEQKARLVSCA